MSKEMPVLMDPEELAAFLRISPRMARDLCKDFPHFLLGNKTRRYSPEEVLDYLRQERDRQAQHAQEAAGLHPRKLKSVR